MKKPLIAYCDGGLCNRLNSIIGAVFFSRMLGLELIVSWPINSRCGASFYDLFDASYQINQDSIIDISKFSEKYLLLIHERQLLSRGVRLNPMDSLTVNGIIGKVTERLPDLEGLIYYNSLVPVYISPDATSDIISGIKVKDLFIDKANEFLQEVELVDRPYWGLHLRGTDTGYSKLYYQFWWLVVSKLKCPVVLCTDDENIEASFLKLKHVVSRAKSSFTKKAAPDRDWNDKNIDEYGRESNYNINRDSYAVKEAMVDFVLLSRSKLLLYTSQSTFLENAFRFGGGSKRFFYSHVVIRLGWLRFIYRLFRRKILL